MRIKQILLKLNENREGNLKLRTAEAAGEILDIKPTDGTTKPDSDGNVVMRRDVAKLM